MRRGHTWAGVSAQHNGVHGGVPAVESGLEPRGLTTLDPARYGGLAHPGDAYCLDIYTQVARGVAADLGTECVLGASQSAMALTACLDQVREHPFDSREDYLAAYELAADAAIDAGFVLLRTATRSSGKAR
ncbi:MAG: hypothetical protein JWN22_713 [Nocardioides sp.]|nr:hypothetical protein [Nocardioides sp.]